MRSSLAPGSDVGQRERARLAAVEVCEPVLLGQRGRNDHLPTAAQHFRVPGQGGHCAPDELWALGVAQVEDPAASTASVRTSPGYSETAATPCRRSSCAMSAVSLSVAAFATPYSTFPMYFWAAQEERSR